MLNKQEKCKNNRALLYSLVTFYENAGPDDNTLYDAEGYNDGSYLEYMSEIVDNFIASRKLTKKEKVLINKFVDFYDNKEGHTYYDPIQAFETARDKGE